jgi:hypothetical protein
MQSMLPKCPSTDLQEKESAIKEELTEKRITERNLLNPLHIRILHKLRINIKEHRHIHRLPRIQPLFLEAKTLNLAKIRRYLSGRNAVCRHADDIFRRFVRRSIKRECSFTRQDTHFALLGSEGPGKDVRDGPVEGYADAFGGGYGDEAGGGVGGGVGGGFDGLATPASGLADL